MIAAIKNIDNNNRWQNLIVYYIVILVPLGMLIFLSKTHQINSDLFAILILSYFFPYRFITDYYRLLNKGIINKKDFWKLFNPFFWRLKFYKELYSL